MVGNSLGGVEDEIGVFCSDVNDEEMLFPCLEITLKVSVPVFLLVASIELGGYSMKIRVHVIEPGVADQCIYVSMLSA